MTGLMKKVATLAITLACTATAAGPPMTYAGAPGKEPVEIKVRVTEKGFLDEKGQPYTAKNILNIPNGALVTITFVFSKEMSSLAVGDTHQVAIKSEDGWKQETGKLWIMSQESSVTFRAGQDGRTHYRAYCILDCIGMEHLTKLLIHVV